MMKSMKALLAAGVAVTALGGASAYAADMPVKAPFHKAPPFPAYNWTGFYLGVNTGLGASKTSATSHATDGIIDRGGVGFASGGQAGFNWQFAPQLLAGIEGDIGYLGIKRSSEDWDGNTAFGVKTDWYATLRGRLGYTNGPSLFYATGGAAFVNVKNNFDVIPVPGTPTFASTSKTATGGALGGGIETLLGGNWSAKAEYLYIDAGSEDVFNPARLETSHFDNRFHIYRYGLNYKFGAPVATAALPARNWTGFYVGVNGGAELMQDAITAPAPTAVFPGTSVDLVKDGFTGGGQIGFNWQVAPALVVGVEGDISSLRNNRLITDWNDTVQFGAKTNWDSTIRGRLGYSTGPALLYATGGAAFVRLTNSVASDVNALPVSQSKTAKGWTAGGGIEAALAPNWTAKTEYLYIDAGSQDVLNTDAIVDGPAHFDNRFHIFRFGLNYAFGGH